MLPLQTTAPGAPRLRHVHVHLQDSPVAYTMQLGAVALFCLLSHMLRVAADADLPSEALSFMATYCVLLGINVLYNALLGGSTARAGAEGATVTCLHSPSTVVSVVHEEGPACCITWARACMHACPAARCFAIGAGAAPSSPSAVAAACGCALPCAPN